MAGVVLAALGLANPQVHVGGPVVFRHPLLLHLHEVFHLLWFEFAGVLSTEKGGAVGAGRRVVFYPARRVPVGARMLAQVRGITLLVAEEQRHAVVCACDDQGATRMMQVLHAAAAQPVGQGDGFHLRRSFRSVHGRL